MPRKNRPKLRLVETNQLSFGSEYDQQLEADEREFAPLRNFWGQPPRAQDISLLCADEPIAHYERIARATGMMLERTAERVRRRFAPESGPDLRDVNADEST